MLKKKHKKAIEFIRENLNQCPYCGERYDVGVCLEITQFILLALVDIADTK